jgi:hypothetical protein
MRAIPLNTKPSIYFSLLIVSLLTAYFAAPPMFSVWTRVIPFLQDGTTTHLHLYGSARWLAVGAVGFTWWLLYQSHLIRLWQWRFSKWLTVWMVSTAIIVQLLNAYSLCTDWGAWMDSGYRPFYWTDEQARFIQTYVIPLNVLIGPLGLHFSVSKAGTIGVNVFQSLQPNGLDSRFTWMDWGLTLLWWAAMGWLYFRLSLRMGRHLYKSLYKGNGQDETSRKFYRGMVKGWGGLLWLVTYLNLFIPGSQMDTQDLMYSLLNLLASTFILLVISMPFTWIYYRLAALLIQNSRGFAKQV